MAKVRHPGPVILEEVIKSRGLTISDAARILRVDRSGLSQILHGLWPVTLNMALRVQKAFGVRAETYLIMQLEWDMRMKKIALPGVRRWEPPKTEAKDASEAELVAN